MNNDNLSNKSSSSNQGRQRIPNANRPLASSWISPSPNSTFMPFRKVEQNVFIVPPQQIQSPANIEHVAPEEVPEGQLLRQQDQTRRKPRAAKKFINYAESESGSELSVSESGLHRGRREKRGRISGLFHHGPISVREYDSS